MPAISFQRGFLDALLRGDKQQTTRRQTDRIKVGDVCNIYIEQRTPLTDKPIRVMTGAGHTAIADRVNDARYNYPAECPPAPFRDKFEPVYYAHILGKVMITGVYNICPNEMSGEELEAWAWGDGFNNLYPTAWRLGDAIKDGVEYWFLRQYDDDWLQRTWTVIKWNGWTERYFKPE